jgi:glutaconyl-CoA/methylmalonyl-CoA decarboxylase subunit gamma
MIVEITLDGKERERIDVKNENGKYYASFLDRKELKIEEIDFKECGEFYSIILEGKPYLIKLVEDGNVLRASTGSFTTSLKAEKQDRRIRRELRESFTAKSNVLTTRIPGKIMDVMVKKGKTIKKGDSLFILEAMKMENRVFSLRDGVIKDIKVKKGDILAAGDTLLTYEKMI